MRLSKLQIFTISALIITVSLAFISMQLSKYALDVSLNHWQKGASGFAAVSHDQEVSGKPIVLFFHTEWCDNCKELREQVLAKPDVSDFFSTMHPVQINPETGIPEKRLADKFNVIGYPTVYLFDAITERKEQIHGLFNISTQEFIDEVKKAEKRLFL